MEAKVFEVRDVGTFLPVIAIKLNPHNEAERYLLARSGYRRTYVEQSTFIILIRAYAENTPAKANYGEDLWGDRTMTVAHEYIKHNWFALDNGAVIDVQYILHETVAPKLSEARDDNG